MSGSVLIAGIGNIFLGDDAFGVEAVRALMARKLPQGVVVKDFGIRGFDLAYALLDPWQTVILADAMPRNHEPGTLCVLEPNLRGLCDPAREGLDLNPHGMDPMRVLNLAASLGPITARILIVGCEPADFGDELEGRMGLSPAVAASIPAAADMIEDLVEKVIGKRSEQRDIEVVER